MSAVAEATTTLTHLIEAVMQQKQIFNHLIEAGVCSIAAAVSNAIQRYTTLFSGIQRYSAVY
jgi:hypothetical protein